MTYASSDKSKVIFQKEPTIMKKSSRAMGASKKASLFPLFFVLLMVSAVLSSCSSRSSGPKSEIIIKDYPEYSTEDSSTSETKFGSVSDYLASIGITVEDEPTSAAESGSEGDTTDSSTADLGNATPIGIVPDSSPASPADITETADSTGTTPAGTTPTGTDNTGTGNATSEVQEFKVYFIEVGQGDSSLIICDGHSMLIDGGQTSQSDAIFTFLNSRGVTHLDYIVASCLDESHIGGLTGALNCATVDKVLSPSNTSDKEPVQAFFKALTDKNIAVTVPSAGDVFSLGSAKITVLGPVKNGNNDNNNSLVLRIVHGENSILFAGDAEQLEENDILQSGAELSSTILKVGNHGSSSSTGSEWLKAINPFAAVISCGSDNEYGYPSATVLDSLKNNGVKVYRTDLQGFLKVTEENGKFEYRIARNASIDVFIPGVSLVIRPDGSTQQ